MNIAHVIRNLARTQPHAVALIEGQTMLSYAALGVTVRNAAVWLHRQGITPGTMVGVTLGQTIGHVITVLALARLGAVSVPVHMATKPEVRKLLCQRYRVSVLITGRAGVAPEGVSEILIDQDSFRGGGDPGELPPVSGSGVFRLGLSSGTTGVPKAVGMTHDRQLQAAWLQDGLPATQIHARAVVFMDLNVSAGWSSCMRQLVSGKTAVLVRSTAPEAFFEAIDRHGATSTQTSPAILRSLVDAVKGSFPRVPGIERLFAAGGLISSTMQQRIRTRITPNLYSRYGSTETGLISVAAPRDMVRSPNSVGRVVPWVELEVVDENDRLLPPGRTGIVRLRSPEMPDGYFDNPEESAKTFRDGWVYLGDMGALAPDGLLTLEGRADDLINVGGVKVNPIEVEAVLAEHPSIADAGAFATQVPGGATRLVAAVVVREGYDEKAVLAYCRERLRNVAPVRLVSLPRLPRNAAGKLVRRELSENIRLDRGSKAEERDPGRSPDASGEGGFDAT